MALADSQYFKVSEFACHDGTPYPQEWADQWSTLSRLCDAIRASWGGPIVVVSGYRTPEHNAALVAADAATGSHQVASGSIHMQGLAADLRLLTGTTQELFQHIMAMHGFGELPDLGGIGFYPVSNWVHVDAFHAADGHLRTWPGH